MDDSTSLPSPTNFIVEATTTTDADALWDQFNEFYNKNRKVIEVSMKADMYSTAPGKTASDIDLQTDTYLESTKVILDGLVGLGKIHPIIGVAVFAFHAVVSLNFSRPNNDRKATAILLEMQNMMCTMFQLRHLKYTDIQRGERDAENLHLDRLINNIRNDILQCGSDLNYYRNQKLVYKLIKAEQFEQRFRTHTENFARRRSELQNTFAVYIAGGVHRPNVATTGVSTTVDAIDSKPNYLVDGSLHKLDTPQEKEALQFLEQNSGVENCISKDDLLSRLLRMTGDVLPDSENEPELKPDERILKSREVLMGDVRLDVEEALKQHTLHFEKILKNQNDVIARLLEKQEEYQKATTSKLDKLHDSYHIARETQRPSSKTWKQDPEHRQPIPTGPNEDYRQQYGVPSPEMSRVHASAAQHIEPQVRSEREGPSSAAMFTNAHVGIIYGGTFINIYQSESPPAQGDGSVSRGTAQ